MASAQLLPPAAPGSSELPLFSLRTTHDECPGNECQPIKRLFTSTGVVYEGHPGQPAALSRGRPAGRERARAVRKAAPKSITAPADALSSGAAVPELAG